MGNPEITVSISLSMGFPGSLAGKESTFNVGNRGLILGMAWQPAPVFLPGEFHGILGARQATVCGLAKSQTELCDSAQHRSLFVGHFLFLLPMMV